MTSFEEAMAATAKPVRKDCIITRLLQTLATEVGEDFHAALQADGADLTHLTRALGYLTKQKVNRSSLARHRDGECGCGSQ